jgi:hypothetical protein
MVLLEFPDFVEPHGLLAVVLEHEVVVLVDEDLRTRQDFARSFVVLIELDFDDGEGIVHGARLVARLSETDGSIGPEDDATAAIVERTLTRVA